MEGAKPWMPSREFLQDCSRGIQRPVIHCDDFKVRLIERRKRGQRGRQLFFFIARRKNQRYLRALGILSRSIILDSRQTQRAVGNSQAVKNPEGSNQSEKPDSRYVLDFCRRNWCQRSPRGILAQDRKRN